MFGHCFPRRILIGAASNTFPIGKNEPLMKANFPDDVLGHFRASGSELMTAYADSIAGPLKPIPMCISSTGPPARFRRQPFCRMGPMLRSLALGRRGSGYHVRAVKHIPSFSKCTAAAGHPISPLSLPTRLPLPGLFRGSECDAVAPGNPARHAEPL